MHQVTHIRRRERTFREQRCENAAAARQDQPPSPRETHEEETAAQNQSVPTRRHDSKSLLLTEMETLRRSACVDWRRLGATRANGSIFG